MRVASLVAVLLFVILVCWNLQRRRDYRILSFSEDAKRVATVRRINYLGIPFGPVIHIECYGSLDKSTDLSDPAYRTSPNKPAVWTGAVGTKHWADGGCRPLPIGFNVQFDRQKFPANYLDYDTAQENSDTWYWHSYWEIKSEE